MPSRFERLIVVGIDEAALFAQEHPAQPLHGRILVDADVPEEVGRVVRNARGLAENHVVASLGDAARGELQARHGDEARAVQALEGLREVRHPDGCFERPVGNVGLIRHEGIFGLDILRGNEARLHEAVAQNVGFVQRSGAREFDERVRSVHHVGDRVPADGLRADVGIVFVRRIDGEVERPGFELHPDVDVKRTKVDRSERRRRDDRGKSGYEIVVDAVVDRTHAEGAREFRRIEAAAGAREKLLVVEEHRAQNGLDFARPRGRQHPEVVAREEFVAEDEAQFREHAARRSDARHAALRRLRKIERLKERDEETHRSHVQSRQFLFRHSGTPPE